MKALSFIGYSECLGAKKMALVVVLSIHWNSYAYSAKFSPADFADFRGGLLIASVLLFGRLLHLPEKGRFAMTRSLI